jgi:hypothetical protein
VVNCGHSCIEIPKSVSECIFPGQLKFNSLSPGGVSQGECPKLLPFLYRGAQIRQRVYFLRPAEIQLADPGGGVSELNFRQRVYCQRPSKFNSLTPGGVSASGISQAVPPRQKSCDHTLRDIMYDEEFIFLHWSQGPCAPTLAVFARFDSLTPGGVSELVFRSFRNSTR